MYKIDAWDKKIVGLIEFNYKLSLQEIAKKIKRSKTFVAYRIKQLEENKIINYIPLIDFSKLGFTYYRVKIETTLSWNEIESKLKEVSNPIWVVQRYDKENFVFVILAKSINEFQNIWENIQEKIEDKVQNKDISIVYKVHHLQNTYLLNNKREKHLVTGSGKQVEINKLQQEIIKKIQEKPKITIQELIKITKAHNNTIKNSIQDLENKEIIIAYQTIINKEPLNIHHYKFYLTIPFSKENKQRVINILSKEKNIVYISETTYHHDLEFEVQCLNESDLEKTIKNIKSKTDIKRIIVSHTIRESKKN